MRLAMKDTEHLTKTLIELSTTHGGAWVGIRRGFGNTFEFRRYDCPSKVPDQLLELTRYDYTAPKKGIIGYRGKVQGFTPGAVKRESQKGYRRD